MRTASFSYIGLICVKLKGYRNCVLFRAVFAGIPRTEGY